MSSSRETSSSPTISGTGGVNVLRFVQPPDFRVELSSTGTSSQCSKALNAHPYLVTEEVSYEPPADPDSGETASLLFCYRTGLIRLRVLCRVTGLSLEELGLRALERIPRERAIDGIQAFMDLRFVSVASFSPSYLTSGFRQRWTNAVPQTIRGTRKRSERE